MAKHGTLTMRKDGGCHCPPCVGALTQWAANRRKQIAYGRWKPFVDAERARRHVRELMEYGIGWQQVVRLSGVSKTAVGMLLFGNPRKGQRPTKRIRPETEAKLLAVTKTPGNIAKWMDACGARRRLQALAVLGWSMKCLAARAGMHEATLGDICSGRRTRAEAATVRAVAALYNDLWDQAPPQETTRQRRGAALTRSRAQRLGWLPPAAWDDALIDLPDDELQAELSRQVDLMDDDELAWAYNARRRHGDMSPLTLEAAREYKRRQKQQRRELGEAS
jgi:transcriptional regulator with XRE-family HTH domain